MVGVRPRQGHHHGISVVSSAGTSRRIGARSWATGPTPPVSPFWISSAARNAARAPLGGEQNIIAVSALPSPRDINMGQCRSGCCRAAGAEEREGCVYEFGKQLKEVVIQNRLGFQVPLRYTALCCITIVLQQLGHGRYRTDHPDPCPTSSHLLLHRSSPMKCVSPATSCHQQAGPCRGSHC